MRSSSEGCSEKQRNSYSSPRHVHFGAPVRRRPSHDAVPGQQPNGGCLEGEPTTTAADAAESPYIVIHRDEFSELVNVAQSLTGAVVRLYAWAAATGRKLGLDDMPLMPSDGPKEDPRRGTPASQERKSLSKNVC